MREIEFAVYGHGHIYVFPPGEILSQGCIYDYAGKYGQNATKTLVEAPLSDQQRSSGMALAKKAYAIAGCDGFARVDCFLDDTGQFVLNEINPIPGFTANSLFPLICQAHGFELIDNLVALGLYNKRQK